MTKTKINPFKVYSLEEVEKDLNKLKPIKFKTLGFKPTNVNDILTNLLDNKASTYSIKGRLQCEGGRSRGVADIYRLCRYYFPDVTLEEVYTTLRNKKIGSSFCGTTNQDVYHRISQPEFRSYPAKIRLSNRKAVRIE